MSKLKQEKLKLVLNKVPAGFFIDSRWMTKHHISRTSVYNYVKQGWLERVMRGVYRRPPSWGKHNPKDWKTPVLSMQWLMGYNIHVGGLTALDLAGYSHYLAIGESERVCLYADKAPSQLLKWPLTAKFILRNTNLFDDTKLGIENTEFQLAERNGEFRSFWDWPIRTSSIERAILEALDEVPDQESFDILDKLFESLVNLSPQKMSLLLKSCRKVQVKRLFFVFADKHSHAWRKHLDSSDFNLGSGDRAFVRGGKLHPIYRITVPAEFLPQIQEVDHGA